MGLKVFALRYALFSVCLMLAGCAAIEPQPVPTEPVGAAFVLSGRVSVKYGTEAASGNILWQHDATGDDLLFSTPFGQGVARIERRNGLVSLTTPDQKMHQASDVETLTELMLGWRLPLAGLPDWVRGRALAGVPSQARLDGAQRLAELWQSGWRVEFLAYKSEHGLPALLRLSREEVEIRLVIEKWQRAP